MKRVMDIALATAAFVVLLPIYLLVAISVALKLGRPIYFWQVRPGLHGRPFPFFKFRTMRSEVDDRGSVLPDGQRLCGFGRWLRATSLDELPSLLLVIKGDMSLVGPRPLLVEYLPLYSPFHARRHELKPGITGWAQVNGRNSISWKEKLDLDVWYVDNRTIWLDLKILCLTIKRVLCREGVSADGEATMTRFLGVKDD